MTTSETITTVLLGFLSLAWIGDLIRGMFQRKKVQSETQVDEANATQILIAGANTLVTPLTNRLREAEDEATLLRRELQAVRKELQTTLQELNDARTELKMERAENRRVSNENRRLRAQLSNGTT
jgi:uncharacterized protein (DUF3084 family)